MEITKYTVERDCKDCVTLITAISMDRFDKDTMYEHEYRFGKDELSEAISQYNRLSTVEGVDVFMNVFDEHNNLVTSMSNI